MSRQRWKARKTEQNLDTIYVDQQMLLYLGKLYIAKPTCTMAAHAKYLSTINDQQYRLTGSDHVSCFTLFFHKHLKYKDYQKG